MSITVGNNVLDGGLTPVLISGTIANRPTTAVLGTKYFATDTLQIFNWNGSSWDDFETGNVTGSGTAGKLVKFTSAAVVGDSIVTEIGTTITVAGDILTSSANGGLFTTGANGGVFFSTSASYPSGLGIWWNSTRNKGILLNASQNVIFRSGAGDNSALFAGGNWGFGTTTDAGFKVDINGTFRAQGNTTIVGNVDASSDSAYSATFGLTKLGNVGIANFAGISHSSQYNSSGYALIQSAAGATFLNAASGQVITFRNNNSNIGTWSATGLNVVGTLGINNGTDNVKSGTYTPSATSLTNLSAATPSVCQYMRVGNVVTVSGSIDITTAGAGGFGFNLSLPVVTNNFTGTFQAGGAALSGSVNLPQAYIIASFGAQTVSFGGNNGGAVGSTTFNFSFTYLIV